jgi:hypothetical protein
MMKKIALLATIALMFPLAACGAGDMFGDPNTDGQSLQPDDAPDAREGRRGDRGNRGDRGDRDEGPDHGDGGDCDEDWEGDGEEHCYEQEEDGFTIIECEGDGYECYWIIDEEGEIVEEECFEDEPHDRDDWGGDRDECDLEEPDECDNDEDDDGCDLEEPDECDNDEDRDDDEGGDEEECESFEDDGATIIICEGDDYLCFTVIDEEGDVIEEECFTEDELEDEIGECDEDPDGCDDWDDEEGDDDWDDEDWDRDECDEDAEEEECEDEDEDERP